MMYALAAIAYFLVGFVLVALAYRFGGLARCELATGFLTVAAWPVVILIGIGVLIINLVAYANDRIFDLIDGKGN